MTPASPDSARHAKPFRRAVRWLVVPAALYSVAFVALTWPWAPHFTSAFFCDDTDGYQNVWNLWWVGTAVRAGRSPWFTPLLHAPGGTTLLGHTLNPFNGFAAMIASAAGAPLVVQHNLIVAFSFVAAGVTASRLAADVGGSYLGGLAGGFAFTFCGFHVEHAHGHLQLVSVEWLPLFLLLWGRLLRRPTAAAGVTAACALCLVLLCDYYYFAFAAILAGVQLTWSLVARRPRLTWGLVRALGPFVIVAMAGAGPIVLSLLGLDLHGAHDATYGSADLLAPVIPGDGWWARRLTEPFWSRLPTYPNEASVYLGLSVVALAVLGVARSDRPGRWWWAASGTGFFVLALGPGLQVWGHRVTGDWLPYAGLARLSSTVRLSGMPVRLMAVPSLAAAVLAACGVPVLLAGRGAAARVVIVALLGVWLCVDLWPAPLPLAPVAVPPWVIALRDLPGPGAMLDVTDTGTGQALYYQTVHHRPMASGYIARVPVEVLQADAQLGAAVLARNWRAVRHRFGFRYLVMAAGTARPSRAVVYNGTDRRIIDLDAL